MRPLRLSLLFAGPWTASLPWVAVPPQTPQSPEPRQSPGGASAVRVLGAEPARPALPPRTIGETCPGDTVACHLPRNWNCCPSSQPCCGPGCCARGFECVDAAVGMCCSAGKRLCGGMCVDGECCGAAGGCGRGERCCGGGCCAEGQVCDWGERCVHVGTGAAADGLLGERPGWVAAGAVLGVRLLVRLVG